MTNKIIPHQSTLDTSRSASGFAKYSIRFFSVMVATEIIAKNVLDERNPDVLAIMAAFVGLASIAYLVSNIVSQVFFFKYTREKRKDLIDNGLGSSLLNSKSKGYF